MTNEDKLIQDIVKKANRLRNKLVANVNIINKDLEDAQSNFELINEVNQSVTDLTTLYQNKVHTLEDLLKQKDVKIEELTKKLDEMSEISQITTE